MRRCPVSNTIVAVVVAFGFAPVRAADPPVAVRQVLPPAVFHGQGFSAEVYVTNTAAHTVDDVRLTGAWSAGYRMTESNPGQFPGGDGKTTWSLGRLSPGEARQVRVTFAPTDQNPGTEFRSEFEASFRGTKADVQTVPVRRMSMDLEVTGPAIALLGQPVRVHVSLKNSGSAEASGVKLSSKLPAGLTHPSGTDLEADVPIMQAGHTEAVPLELTVTKAGPVRAVFKVAGPGLQPVEREVNLMVLDARFDLEASGPKTLPQGWPGTYEISVRNAGTQPAPGVTLEVVVPPGFDDQNLRATDGAKFDPAGRKLLWTLGEMKAGEVKTLIWLGIGSKPGEAVPTATVRLSGVVAKEAEWRTTVQPSAAK
ncbi:MAG: hypothetical protein ACRC7O_02825 [Fimbriiglobus sp.]